MSLTFPQLREFDRVRTLYEKYLEVIILDMIYLNASLISNDIRQFDPTNSPAWIKYAEVETQLEDFSRTRGIFELGVSQPQLSMPELLWKAYIDFETDEGEREKARALYERLLALSGHVKVWISYALFEATPLPLPRSKRGDDEGDGDGEGEELATTPGDVDLARRVFQRGYEDLKSKGFKAEVGKLPLALTPNSLLAQLAAGGLVRELEALRRDEWL